MVRNTAALLLVFLSGTAISDPEACLRVSYWMAVDDDDTVVNNSCDGPPTLANTRPVGTKPLENCASFKMDDHVLSVDLYCDFMPHKLSHQNSYFGTKDCQKDDAILSMEQTAKSGKCIGIAGSSYMYECLEGPCPADDENSMSLGDVSQVVLDIHREMFRF